MKKFDEKLKECAANARRNKASDTNMPFRFADHVLDRLSRAEDIGFSDEVTIDLLKVDGENE